MKKLLKALGFLLVALVLGFVVLAFVSRQADGPLVELLPGGPLMTGEWVDEEPREWSFVADEMFVELESAGRSRKTFIVTVDGKAYIPASLGFPPFKTWHEEALEKPEAIVRIAGKRYSRSLSKIDDPALETRLRERIRSKYGGSPPGTDAGVWFFRLDRGV